MRNRRELIFYPHFTPFALFLPFTGRVWSIKLLFHPLTWQMQAVLSFIPVSWYQWGSRNKLDMVVASRATSHQYVSPLPGVSSRVQVDLNLHLHLDLMRLSSNVRTDMISTFRYSWYQWEPMETWLPTLPVINLPTHPEATTVRVSPLLTFAWSLQDSARTCSYNAQHPVPTPREQWEVQAASHLL